MKQKDFVFGMAFGLMVGAVAGVLFAPARGAEMRRRVLYERDYAVDSARYKARRAMERLRLVQAEAQDGTEEVEDAFSGA